MSEYPPDDQRIFMCPVHSFVIVAKQGEASCHDSPGHRSSDCPTCEQAVTDALAAIGWDDRDDEPSEAELIRYYHSGSGEDPVARQQIRDAGRPGL